MTMDTVYKNIDAVREELKQAQPSREKAVSLQSEYLELESIRYHRLSLETPEDELAHPI